MSEHLSKETTARLLSREVQPDELVTASRHLSLCAECRQQLHVAKGLAASARFLVNDLKGSLRADDLHLSYELLEGYVDEILPPAELERVNKHLGTCDSCAQEAKELRFLANGLSSHPQVTTGVAAAPLPPGGSVFQRFAALFGFRSLQFAGLAALLLLAVVVGLLLWQSKRQTQLANLNKDGQTKASDSSPNSNTGPTDEAQTQPGKEENNKNGNSNGDATESAYDSVVATAIAKQALPTPPALKELNGRPVTLLGPSDPAQQGFDLLSPRGTVVQSSRPTLRWRALAGAESYQVYLLNTNFDVVQKSGSLSSNSWTVTRSLDRGQTYIWQVVASKEGKEIAAPVAPARDARFKVLDSKSEQAIQRFAQDNPENHLALGIIYAHHGLLDEAARQLSSAATLKQSPELARKFLRDVKTMRR